MSGESGGHRLRLSMLNDQLTCKLCRGYFIDATTIIECLHSFCRSCIVKYLENNKYCPICEVQVHKSKPLLNIRPDHTLQDIVYKLVPACYQNEMRCRRDFYAKNPEALRSTTSPEARGEPVESHIYSPDESLSLSLEYYNPIDQPVIGELGVDDAKETGGGGRKQLQQDQKDQQLQQKPRYLRCPAAVMVFHLQKLIRAKYGLSEAHRVDVMYKEETLCDSYTLMDVMYIYHWRRKVPLHLSYRIFESSPKRLKLAEDNENFKQSLTNAGISPVDPRGEVQKPSAGALAPAQQQGVAGGKREWKEVQLKISETGVMSVTDITSPDSKKTSKSEKKQQQAQPASSNSESSSACSGNALEDGKKRGEDPSSCEVAASKPEKSRAEPKPAEQSKPREKKPSEALKKPESPKAPSEPSSASPGAKTCAGSSENSSEQPRESCQQSRESNNNERTAITRETRSRTDLRLSSAVESDQAASKIGSAPAETRRTKAATIEPSPAAEKPPAPAPKSPKPAETPENPGVSGREDDKLENRLQNSAAPGNNLENTSAGDSAASTKDDPPIGNQKSGKIGEAKNSQSALISGAGSKIDALSAKLQFQPKIGEVNSTYSKRGPKEKRTILEKVLKKPATQASSSGSSISAVSASSPSSSSSSSSSSAAESALTVRAISKQPVDSLKTRSSSLASVKSSRIDSNQSVSVSVSTTSGAQSSSSSSQLINCLGGGTTITSTHSSGGVPTPSVTVSVTTSQKIGADRADFRGDSIGNRRASSSTPESSSSVSEVSQNVSEPKSSSKSVYRRDNQSLSTPSSDSLASIGLNVSTSMQNSGGSTFPYTVQDLVNSGILKSTAGATKVSGLTIQKTSGAQGQTSMANNSSLSQVCSSAGTSFNLHTPSMTIYSISAPTKTGIASGSSSSSSSIFPGGSPQIGSSIAKGSSQIGVGKSSNVEITSVYSVPPCPDAIPISLMKPTVRKHEVIAKATNVNEICAKIGENSKEKNKAESRSRPEIPDLLKIAKKPAQSVSSIGTDSATPKHIPNIPNVPIYTPSNSASSIGADSKLSYSKDVNSSITSKTSLNSASSAAQSTLQVAKPPGIGGPKKQSQSMGYTTLRHPPKSWNPTLSKNNYVAMKNQAKESSQLAQQQQQNSALLSQQQQQQQQQQQSQESCGSVKSAGVKRPDSAKRRNTPRFLGNPASGVKPLYGVTEAKAAAESRDVSQAAISASGGGKPSVIGMTKIDPKTLSPIVSTSNSPIVSPPPYSPGARGTCYQSFTREMCARSSSGGGGSPISSRNSPVNMLSTNPFIPSPTPNTHPRLFYPHYPPPFPDSPRLTNNPLIRSPIGIPPPSAYHSSLPPSINKFLQRTSYMPQTAGVYSQQLAQPPTVQRIPASSSSASSSSSPSASSASPKSPKKSSSPGFAIGKNETQTSIGGSNADGKNVVGLLAKSAQQQETNAFNLSKTGAAIAQTGIEGERSEANEKEPGKIGAGKRENLGKIKEAAEKLNRRASADIERAKARDEEEDRSLVSGGKKGLCEERENVASRKSAERDKSAAEETREAAAAESRKKESEKIGAKVNGDLNAENNSSAEAKIQENLHRNDATKDCRGLDAGKNFQRENKDADGKQILAGQGNNNSAGEKNPGTKECNEKKIEEQIGKSAEIQGKNSKNSSADCQRNKAES